MLHRHDDYLCEIDGRTAADGDDQVSSCVLCLTSNLDSLLARRMLCNSVKGGDMVVAERVTNLSISSVVFVFKVRLARSKTRVAFSRPVSSFKASDAALP
jgi:hypothetical protein